MWKRKTNKIGGKRMMTEQNFEPATRPVPFVARDQQELKQINGMEHGMPRKDNEDLNEIETKDGEETIDEFIRLSCDENFQKPVCVRHFSLSEVSVNSNESSPLLIPHKRTRGSQKLIWFQHAWRWYEKKINRRPLVTKSITSGCMTLMADLVGQRMEHHYNGLHENMYVIGHAGSVDVVRLARFATMGMFLQAPITHYYYVALDHYLPPTSYPWTPTTFLKLLIDQTIYAPTFMFLVIIYLAFFSGSSLKDIEEQLEKEYWKTVVNNWKLWVPATLINMAYVPPAFRVLYCNVVFFAWSIYLSLALNNQGKG